MMTKSWQKRHWFFLILGVCLLILVLWPGSGVSDAIRVIAHGLLNLLGQIFQELVRLIGQLIDKV
jgi:hypothetical protein